jgi:hypothetical protein
MNTELIAAVLDSPSGKAIEDLLNDESSVFQVDWRQDDETIVDACESVLQTGRLLNEVLSPDYEVRYCIDSHGGDTGAFLPLPTKVWAELESRYGDAVSRRFYRISALPNLFTHRLEFE